MYVATWRLFMDSFIYPSYDDKLDKHINLSGKTPTRLTSNSMCVNVRARASVCVCVWWGFMSYGETIYA